MSRIRFSDQVLSSEDVSSSAAMTNTSSRRQSFATSSSNGNNNMLGTIGRGHSIQLSDLGGPASSSTVGRSPSRRSLDNRGVGGVMYRRGPASIAASDTSSAAGFRPSSRMMHHSTSVDYTPNHGFASGHRRMGSLYRSNAIDDDVSPGNPRYSGQQEYVDEVDYRNGGGGGNGVPPSINGVPTLDVASVTASSPYSPRSGDSSGYNPNATTVPILKNGTLPRSRQNSTAYGTMERNRNGRLSVGGNCEPPIYANSDFGGTVPHRPPSRAATVNSACGGGGGYGNGSTAGSVSSYGGGSGHHHVRPSQLNNGNLRRPGMPTSRQQQHNNNNNIHRNSSHITPNPLDDMMATASDFPTLPPRRSESTPVIATPHRPCCECNLISRVTGRDGDGTQQYPIAFLFSIFLIFSVVIVSGIMLYLRGGTVDASLTTLTQLTY